MGEAACRGPIERHSTGPNLALNGPVSLIVSLPVAGFLGPVRVLFPNGISIGWTDYATSEHLCLFMSAHYTVFFCIYFIYIFN